MVLFNNEIRAKARAQLKGRWGKPVLVCLVYLIVVMVISLIPFIGGIVSLFITGPLILGLMAFFLKFANEEPVEAKNLFDGFHSFGAALGLNLWMGLWIFLWTLLLVVPGIVKALSYSMSFFIMADNPQMGAREALNISKKITMGYKGRIFGMQLSFIGWFILACLTLGIGFLWVVPYMQLSLANLYKELKAEAVANGRYNASLTEKLSVSN